MSCNLPTTWEEPEKSKYLYDGKYPSGVKAELELWFTGEMKYPLDRTPVIYVRAAPAGFTVIVVESGGYPESNPVFRSSLKRAKDAAIGLALVLQTEEQINDYVENSDKYPLFRSRS